MSYSQYLLELSPIQSWLKPVTIPLVIGGPCSAESFKQVMDTARALFESGKVSVFRAGIWKPRSRPLGFQGAGEEGLKWLSKVKKTFKMPVAVEVAIPRHVELADKYDIDILWIGARTVVNPFSVEELTKSLKGIERPVFVKNPINPDINLWIGAIERVNKAGIKKIAAIHRGFQGLTRTKYRNEPMWEIPLELKRLFPEMPIITDPSHISGSRALLKDICQKSIDFQMDGLMIESHINPSKALTDIDQQITPAELSRIIDSLIIRKKRKTKSFNTLDVLRNEIDSIDHELLGILAKRMEMAIKIGHYKKENNIDSIQPKHWKKIIEERISFGGSSGLDEEFLRELFDLIHQESIKKQNDIIKKKD